MIQHLVRANPHRIRTVQGASTLPPSSLGQRHRRLLSFPLLGMVFFLLIFPILAGCATSSKPPSLLALRVARIHTALQNIAESYVNKDLTRLLLDVDPSLAARSSFRDPIEQDFKTFEMTLRMEINRVEVLPSMIRTEILWEGTWTASSSAPLYQTGHALMEWSTDESPRLLEIRGETPWGISPLGSFQNG